MSWTVYNGRLKINEQAEKTLQTLGKFPNRVVRDGDGSFRIVFVFDRCRSAAAPYFWRFPRAAVWAPFLAGLSSSVLLSTY